MIWETGDPDLFPELKIPRSTIRSWLHRGIPDVVTCDSLSAEKTELLAELRELRHRAAVLGAIVGLARLAGSRGRPARPPPLLRRCCQRGGSLIEPTGPEHPAAWDASR